MKYLCRQGKEMPGGANADAPPLFVDRCLLIVIQRTTGTIPDQFWKSPLLLKNLNKLHQLSMYLYFVW